MNTSAMTNSPVVCDLTNAPDTPAQRMDAYRQLFADALIGRSRTTQGARFRFRADAGVETRVRELVRREHECCAFMTFNLTNANDEIIVDVTTTTTTGDEMARNVLDEFLGRLDGVSVGTSALDDRYTDAGPAFALDPRMLDASDAAESCATDRSCAGSGCTTPTTPTAAAVGSGRDRAVRKKGLVAVLVGVVCMLGCAAVPLAVGGFGAAVAAIAGESWIIGATVVVAGSIYVHARAKQRQVQAPRQPDQQTAQPRTGCGC
jgi:hypothetical protein